MCSEGMISIKENSPTLIGMAQAEVASISPVQAGFCSLLMPPLMNKSSPGWVTFLTKTTVLCSVPDGLVVVALFVAVAARFF